MQDALKEYLFKNLNHICYCIFKCHTSSTSTPMYIHCVSSFHSWRLQQIGLLQKNVELYFLQLIITAIWYDKANCGDLLLPK